MPPTIKTTTAAAPNHFTTHALCITEPTVRQLSEPTRRTKDGRPAPRGEIWPAVSANAGTCDRRRVSTRLVLADDVVAVDADQGPHDAALGGAGLVAVTGPDGDV